MEGKRLLSLERFLDALRGDRTTDGKSVRPLIAGKTGVRSPHEAFYH